MNPTVLFPSRGLPVRRKRDGLMFRVRVAYHGRVWLLDSWGKRVGSLTDDQFTEQFESIDRWEEEARSA